jgi:transposase-like protein
MNLKEEATKLREDGESYNSISKKLGIAKSTLSYWFSKEPVSDETKRINTLKNRADSRDRILAYLKKRSEKLREDEFKTILEAQEDFKKFHTEPLFMAGLMLYAGEGDKASRQNVKFTNSDPLLCKIFIKFIERYFKNIGKDKIKLWCIAYKDHDVATIEGYWLKILGMDRKNLYKTQVIIGRHKTRRLSYGVGNVNISKRLAKVRILELLRLSVKVLGN